MTFKAYLDTIEAKTGKTADDFKHLAEARGFLQDGVLRKDVKAGAIVQWLNDEYGLGRGHAMAICSVLKGENRL